MGIGGGTRPEGRILKPMLKFLQYNNAVPIAISIVLLGAGGAFAATDPAAVYSQSQQVLSIDNTYLVNKDLSTYTPTAQITGVTEDDQNYYIAYSFSTIDLVNSVWQDTVKPETMTVSKADLGPYRDLGVYVTQQLKQNVDNELARLKTTQGIEKQNVTQKVIATTYGGLVGKFLNNTTEALPGYTPVVQGPPDTSQTAAASSAGSPTSSTNTGGTTSVPPSGNPSLQIQILGNNPAQLPLHASYIDLGAVVSDAANDNIGIHTFLDGTEVQQVHIDTSATSTHTVTYKATDPQGNSTSVDRTVYIYDPAVGPPVSQSQVQNGTPAPTTPVSTPVTTPTPPTPAPEAPTPAPAPDTSTPTTTAPADTATTTPSTSDASSTPDTSSGSPDVSTTTQDSGSESASDAASTTTTDATTDDASTTSP